MLCWSLLLRLLPVVVARLRLIDESKQEIVESGNTVWGQHFGSWLVFNSELGLGDAYALEVRLLAVSEVDHNGNQVGTSQNPHTFSFASDDPQFLTRHVQSPTKTGTFGNISAQALVLKSNLARAGQLELQAFILREGGSVGPLEESAIAAQGDVLLRVNLTSWYFCGRCAEVVCMCDDEPPMNGVPSRGNFIDVLFQVIGYSVSSKFDVGAIDLGGGASLEPLGVLLDGSAAAMPIGYPQLGRESSAQVLTLRIPRFQESALHDTVLHLNWTGEVPPWTLRDALLLFGPPIAAVLLTLAAINSRACSPKAVRPDYMERQLQMLRRQRLMKEQQRELERTQPPQEGPEQPKRSAQLELPQLGRPREDRRSGIAGVFTRPSLLPPVQLPSGEVLL